MILKGVPKAKRDSIALVFEVAQKEIKACLSRLRQKSFCFDVDDMCKDDASSHDHSSSSPDSEESTQKKPKKKEFRVSRKTSVVVSVTTGEHCVDCLNNKRKIVLVVNDSTVRFILKWLLPLAQNYVGGSSSVMILMKSQSQNSSQQQDSQTSGVKRHAMP